LGQAGNFGSARGAGSEEKKFGATRGGRRSGKGGAGVRGEAEFGGETVEVGIDRRKPETQGTKQGTETEGSEEEGNEVRPGFELGSDAISRLDVFFMEESFHALGFGVEFEECEGAGLCAKSGEVRRIGCGKSECVDCLLQVLPRVGIVRPKQQILMRGREWIKTIRKHVVKKR